MNFTTDKGFLKVSKKLASARSKKVAWVFYC